MEAEDFLVDSLELLGVPAVDDRDSVRYGEIVVHVAPKEGKANTLLADHVFSPAFLLSERIERGLIPLDNLTVLELGAGAGLPSLIAASISQPPALVVVTDHPDEIILGNLRKNVQANMVTAVLNPECQMKCIGYEWGSDVSPLLDCIPTHLGNDGYDVMFLSDLLHFDSSKDVLIDAVTSLLARRPTSRVYVAAGKYTPLSVCHLFLRKGEESGLRWEVGEDEVEWKGHVSVNKLTREELSSRKANCRWWIGSWA